MQITDGKVHPRVVSVCPDGTRILFEANAAGGSTVRAWLVSAEGGAPQLLLPEERGPESDVNWSPDGRKIVFGHSPEGGDDPRSDIRILDLDTHQVTIVPGSMGMYSAHWSPDGRYLAALPTKSVGLNTSTSGRGSGQRSITSTTRSTGGRPIASGFISCGRILPASTAFALQAAQRNWSST